MSQNVDEIRNYSQSLRRRIAEIHNPGLEYEITLHTDEVLTLLDAIDAREADCAALRQGIGSALDAVNNVSLLQTGVILTKLWETHNPGQRLLDELIEFRENNMPGPIYIKHLDELTISCDNYKAERDALTTENARLREQLEAAENTITRIAQYSQPLTEPLRLVGPVAFAKAYLAKYATKPQDQDAKEKADAQVPTKGNS